MFTKRILAAAITSQPSANGVADALDFDGTNDYLSRSSDLVRNADGKTFTFSAWILTTTTETSEKYIISNENGRIVLGYTESTNTLVLSGASPSGTLVLRYTISGALAKNTFNHILISISMTNQATSFVYINDKLASYTVNTFTDSKISFARAWHKIGEYGGGVFRGRLSNLFLDYTYRDLSIEANRRLFITADRKPTPKATLQALNPILYLPLDDHTQAGKNLGTGGDFTLNGVVARSGRGPSQFNAAYSDLDGAADYLSRTSALVGIANGKLSTVAFSFNADIFGTGSDNDGHVFVLYDSGSNRNAYYVRARSDYISIAMVDSSTGQMAGYINSPLPTAKSRNYHIVASLNIAANSAKLFVNGIDSGASLVRLNNIDCTFSYCGYSAIGGRWMGGPNSISSFNGRLGNLFFDTKYIDLSQPENLAKFVTGTGIDAKPVDLGANGELPFGTPPLIYLPMYGNNAGKNYGTGGDFTVNSGPFAGARGPNEFWGNKADFDGSTGYLYRSSALAGVSDSQTVSGSFFIQLDALGSQRSVFSILTSGFSDVRFYLLVDNSNNFRLVAYNSSNVKLLEATTTTTALTVGVNHVAFCMTFVASTSNRRIYINGVNQTVTWDNNLTGFANLSLPNIRFAARDDSFPYYLDGKLSEFYFTTDYIDFSQEANRLKFRDAFGNPVDLRPQIQAGTLPNPAIYMRFDPANFGKNSGTGGNFVVNGAITDGGQL